MSRISLLSHVYQIASVHLLLGGNVLKCTQTENSICYQWYLCICYGLSKGALKDTHSRKFILYWGIMCLIIKKIKLLKLSLLNRWILICIYNCLHNPQPQSMFLPVLLDWDGGECTDTTENIKFSVCVDLRASPLKLVANSQIQPKTEYFQSMWTWVHHLLRNNWTGAI